MGKKMNHHHHHQLSATRTTISKESKHEKKHVHSLINALRPKVYITDTSSFKRLVQELTGNNETPSDQIPTTITPILSDPREIQMINSLPVWSNQVAPFSTDVYSDVALEGTTSDKMEDLMLRDLESWLLDVETDQLCTGNSYGGQFEGMMSSFDYELAGFL